MRSGRLSDLVAPGMGDWLAIEVIDEGHQALFEFVFGGDADLSEHRAREFGKEAFDQIEPGTVGRGEGEGKAAWGLRGEPGRGLARDMRRMVVEDNLDC